MPDFSLLSTVALLEDLPSESLNRCDVAKVRTVVEALAPSVYEVESATLPAKRRPRLSSRQTDFALCRRSRHLRRRAAAS
jgi:hypothetical protein